MYAIGVDVGGMSVKVGLVDENGKIVSQSRAKTEPTPEKLLAKLVEQINGLLEEKSLTVKEIKGIGIGLPGAVDNGVVVHLPNLDWTNVNIVEILKKSFDTEIKISNDANVAALYRIHRQ